MVTQKSIFIFPYAQPFSEIQLDKIRKDLSLFLKTWNSHGTDLSAEFRIEENQFILVIVDESSVGVGGCSKDKLYKTISNLNENTGINPGNPGKFFVHSDGKVKEFSRNELQKEVESGRILPENELFPTWITRFQEFENMWSKPISRFESILKL